MADVEVEIDMEAARRLVYGLPGTMKMVEDKTSDICDRANAMADGYRSGLYHRDHKSPAVGDTPAKYDKKAEPRRRTGPYAVPTGIVYTSNYAAEKENMLHNTLLKAMG